MNGRIITLALLLAAGLAACNTKVIDPGPTPPAASMTFKSGARYQYDSYQTDPTTSEKMSATERTRTWTLVNPSASAYGKTGVAVFIDSIVAGGTIVTVADSVLLEQSSGSNDINRYASLAPELDFSGNVPINVDLGRQWMREATLNATTANWFVGEAADTVQMNLNVPGLQGVKVGVADSAIASAQDNVVVNGTSYTATKTTHSLELSISLLVNVPILGVQAIKVKSETLSRTTWTVPSLGAIAREERQGKVIDVSGSTISGVTIPSFSLPVPGYVSVMTQVLATGN
ncbi:MAG: hypothetical protein JST22_17760 [Bacteroidetes bacterium]|nr:hypothetical protein [Bacteroidota bacterium]